MIRKGIRLLPLWCIISLAVFAQSPSNEYSGIQADSLIGHDRGLAYMKNLDSMLRVANHQADSLSNLTRRRNPSHRQNRSLLAAVFNNPASRIMFWSLVVAFFVFIVYKLIDINPFSSNRRRGHADEVPEEPEMQPAEWYDEMIEQAEQRGDLNIATRYLFMKKLLALSDIGAISILPGKTNTSYASEIKNADLRNYFTRISRVYEYVWYGKHEINKDQYSFIKSIFNQPIPGRHEKN